MSYRFDERVLWLQGLKPSHLAAIYGRAESSALPPVRRWQARRALAAASRRRSYVSVEAEKNAAKMAAVQEHLMIRGIIVIAALLLAGCLHFAGAQTSSKARIEAFAKLPDWSGLWEFNIWTDELDGQQMGPEGMRYAKAYAAAMQATFTPAWQAKLDELKKTADAAKKTDAANPPAFEEFGRFGGCGWTPGFPATMLPGTYEWRVTPEETTLISLLGSVRHIYTDGRPHPPKDELWPMSQGDSIGHWEGDTLVVDTVSVRSPVYLPGLARGTGVPALPMSNELHSVERIRMVSHDQMQIQFTLEDPIALAKPVNVTLTWNRVKDINRMEQNADDCDDPSTDRNPIVNGRYTTIPKPTPATPAKPAGR